MSTAALTSLGVLKVNFDRGRDFYDQFIPFVAWAGAHTDSDRISLPEVQAFISDEFDLFIPEYPLRTIISRTADRGYFDQQHDTYRVRYSAVRELDIEELRQEVEESFSTITDRLREHVGERFDRQWSEEETEAALTSYLETHDVDVLFDEVEQPVIPETDPPPDAYDLFLSSFLDEVRREEPEVFDAFVNIVKGHILANVVYYPDFDELESGFEGAEVYLDGPIVLAALGYSGKIRQDPIVEMLELLYEAGAELSCFRHSVREVEEILESCSESLAHGANPGGYSPALEELLSMGMSRSDIWREAQRVPEKLADLRIGIKKRPEPGREDSADEPLLQQLVEDHPTLS